MQLEVTILGKQIRERERNICCHIYVEFKMNLFCKTDPWT